MGRPTKKQHAWNHWSKVAPGTRERTLMMKRCGKRCFLGTKKSFPICSRNTCKKNRLGVLAGYIRAKEYASKSSTSKIHPRTYYSRIAGRANSMLRRYTRKLYV